MKCSVEGLTQNQVVDRRERGLDNRVQFRATRSYLYILRKNAFTFVNAVLFAISLVLILLGQLDDALVTAGLVFLNVCVGILQEGRAKRKLEQIALLARPQATVIRDGREQVVDPAETVQDDVLVIRPGDQFIADGQLIHGSRVEVDESLLTGEADRVRKDPGDPVYSGSFCVSGEGCYRAQKVGADSFVNQLAARVRTFRQIKTPLQRDIDYIIRILVILVAQLGILMALSFAIQGMPLVEGVRAAAVIVALVPQGLFFMTTVSYALGALRVAGKGALIQELNAVESSSNVDLLCLDKTGTLTNNRIRFESMVLLGAADEDTIRCLLGDYAASAGGGNRTMSALHQAFDGESRPIEVEVPFSSDRKWSALLFHEAVARRAHLRGPFYLGAPEVLQPQLGSDPNLASQVDLWTSQGLRVLLFARARETAHLHDTASQPQVPPDLLPLALLGFRDELRPEARETLAHFAELGVGLKIISGDSPETVAALVRQVLADGESSFLPGKLRTVSGIDLEGMEPANLAQVATETTIFGRITPQQKQTLVGLLRRQGHYVAMIGDGVNDVLSLKEADLAVAMQSGSQAARSLADVVLLNDSFAALPIAFREGQRIVRGMEDVVRLLLTRTLYVILLVVATQLVGVPFPVTPKHNAILALVTVGIPILALAAWARPASRRISPALGPKTGPDVPVAVETSVPHSLEISRMGLGPGGRRQRILRATGHFVFPAAFTVAVVALVVYLAYLTLTGDVEIARTALTSVTVLCGVLLIPFVEPPTQAWVGGDELSGDWRPSILALGMLGLFGLIMAIAPLRHFFELSPLRPLDYVVLGSIAVAWALALRLIWRGRLFERLLDPG